MLSLFIRLIGDRKEGFLFLAKPYFMEKKKPAETFASPRALTARLEKLAEGEQDGEDNGPRAVKRRITEYLRQLGQIPEKRVRQEFIKVTKRIGCEEVTRVHSLRHLFSTRAQENEVNPFLVQGILGHTTLDMTSKYTHFGIEAVRKAVAQLIDTDPVLQKVVAGIGV